MTTKLVKGTPVVSLADGTTLGAIDHVYFDPHRMAVVGFTFHQRAGLFGPETSGLVDISDVHAFGPDAVTVDDLSVVRSELAVGEESAVQLGVEAERVKRVVFVAASLLTGVVVAHTGPIAFVGLIVPHMVRMTWGPDYRRVLPLSGFFGATFLILADLIARTVDPGHEIPIGVVTAVVGAPFFLFLLRRQSRPILERA